MFSDITAALSLIYNQHKTLRFPMTINHHAAYFQKVKTTKDLTLRRVGGICTRRWIGNTKGRIIRYAEATENLSGWLHNTPTVRHHPLLLRQLPDGFCTTEHLDETLIWVTKLWWVTPPTNASPFGSQWWPTRCSLSSFKCFFLKTHYFVVIFDI